MRGNTQMKKIFGYVRVSSADQNTARQVKDLQDIGIEERDIFIDKISGKNFDRPEYKTLKGTLRKGDLLYIKSIDRFGRNSNEIKKEWEFITQNIGADIKVLDMPMLDTTQFKDLIGNFVSNLVLEVLSFVAEQERDSIKKRQAEGIAIAQAQGKHLGRPNAEYPKNFKEVYTKWNKGKISGVKAMELMGIKKTTFYKLTKQYEDTK
jgi:DNA invertase Pin-like site-specific DNA recombinase